MGAYVHRAHRMYGVTVSGPVLASMVLTVIMLSLGAPGVPGSGIVCLGVLLEHIGVPIVCDHEQRDRGYGGHHYRS